MATPVHPYSSPSSSVGSAPPVTPETPALEYGYSPFISHGSNSPISPSLISAPTTGYTIPKDILAGSQREPPNVLDLARTAGHPWGGPLVPQKTYRPHTLSDRRRYVEEVQLEEPIMFFTHHPAGCGIMLKDAIASKFSTLIDRDDSMFEGRGPSVSIRLNWPGYAPWSRQIPTRDFRSPPHPITRAKLARNVAKTISRFIQEMESQQQEDANEAKWKVGSSGIKLENLMLVGLQHVSMGSWQAHVRLVQRH
ncbi:hypothetical protein L226DRAFT_544881 [Lentinus tigrinus ALCF2SS1-7]|uniref:Uncharacterized protein n=1 Tax=Lentinus tigrinus ALCF2SS1-6 TaxID=1328759 RepID=A0A5C2SKW6_9APHY|nr:hypothetical protein L227DRAFT_584045 [Lentinus tigrinus ALCF2SS1-6]RPD76478.1 hypothetical protein L226DRAFT_544881 [Lentinus tigrinus ALCF2SS1-7]